jgi:hypothetical protein
LRCTATSGRWCGSASIGRTVQKPNENAITEDLEVCICDDKPATYPPSTASVHLLAKLLGPRTRSTVDVDDRFLDQPRPD